MWLQKRIHAIISYLSYFVSECKKFEHTDVQFWVHSDSASAYNRSEKRGNSHQVTASQPVSPVDHQSSSTFFCY